MVKIVLEIYKLWKRQLLLKKKLETFKGLKRPCGNV